MKNYLTILFSVAALFMVSCSGQNPFGVRNISSCADFSDLAADAVYQVGDEFTTSGGTVSVEKFQRGSGNWTSDGKLIVTRSNRTGGRGLALQTKEVNVSARLHYPVNEITLRFGDWGTTTNIRINGVLKNVNDIVSLNNSTISGVNLIIEAVATGPNWVGMIGLQGIISEFAIGGDEFWIDDICWKKNRTTG